jgi:molybdate transport system regulatory protein
MTFAAQRLPLTRHVSRARDPLVETQMGGSGGGGARLTKLGRDVVGRYRAIEGAAASATAADMRALKAALPNRPFGQAGSNG